MKPARVSRLHTRPKSEISPRRAHAPHDDVRVVQPGGSVVPAVGRSALAETTLSHDARGPGSLPKTLDEVAHGVRLRSGAIQVNHRQGRYTKPVSPRVGRGRGS